MWTVSVKAGQSELNEARVRSELHTNEGSHTTFLNLYRLYFCLLPSFPMFNISTLMYRVIHDDHLEIKLMVNIVTQVI